MSELQYFGTHINGTFYYRCICMKSNFVIMHKRQLSFIGGSEYRICYVTVAPAA